MSDVNLPHETQRALRIRAAAEELILRRGFRGVTMATVAERAHVGKGTAYLYWRTKEELFLEIIVTRLGVVLQRLADQVQADPALASPGALCQATVRAVLGEPLVRALQSRDDDLLGALTDDPRARQLMRDHGAVAIINDLVPLWRTHGTSTTSWPITQQAGAIELLLVGFVESERRGLSPTPGTDRGDLLRSTVDAILDTHAVADPDQAVLATQVRAVLERHRGALLEVAGGRTND